MSAKVTGDIDSDRTGTILDRILEAVEPDQKTQAGYDCIVAALLGALAFQLAQLPTKSRKQAARTLQGDISVALTMANTLARAYETAEAT